MRNLTITIHEPGEMFGTLTRDGRVALFTVSADGTLKPSDNRLFAGDDAEIETLQLTVRAYNVLKREGINTVGEMLAFVNENGPSGLSQLRNLGEKGVDEILDKARELAR